MFAIAKNGVDLMLLGVLRRTPAHGYSIITTLRDQSGGEFDLAEGTIYPALHRLERAGFIESFLSQVDGRRRRTYAVTSKGLAAFDAQRRTWQQYVSGMQAVLA